MKKHTLLLACAMRILLNLIAFPSRGRLFISNSGAATAPLNLEPSFLCCLSIYLYAKIRYYSELSIYGVKKPIEWVVYISQEI